MKIRTRELCPKCGGKFIDIGWTFICKSCLTRPKKYYIEYCWKGRPRKAYKDHLRRPLTGYAQAQRELKLIETLILDGLFNIDEYLGKRSSFYQFDRYAIKWLEKYTKLYDSNRIAPNTYSAVRKYVKLYFIPHFLKTDIREIKNGDIEDFYLSLPSGMSHYFYRGILSYLHKFFADALYRNDIKQMPRFPKITANEERKIVVLSNTVIKKILKKIDPEYQLIIIFLWRHGCRPGEARAVHIEDIDLEKMLVTICRTFSENLLMKKTKTKKTRTIPIHPRAYAAIRKAIKKRREGFVFLNKKTKPFPARTLNMVWNKAVKKAGISPVRLYTLRHSFGTNAINAGAPKDLVLNYMGTTVETYLHKTLDGHKKLLKYI